LWKETATQGHKKSSSLPGPETMKKDKEGQKSLNDIERKKCHPRETPGGNLEGPEKKKRASSLRDGQCSGPSLGSSGDSKTSKREEETCRKSQRNNGSKDSLMQKGGRNKEQKAEKTQH